MPLILDDQIKGLLAVANRDGGYSHEQQADLEAIKPAIMEALHRKKSEGDLLEAYEKLHVQSEELQAQSKRPGAKRGVADSVEEIERKEELQIKFVELHKAMKLGRARRGSDGR